MSVLNRMLDVVAPSFALRRRVQSDDWTKQMTLQLHMAFINDENGSHSPTSQFLQQQAEPLRQQMMGVVLDRIKAVSDAADRKMACRRWLLEEARPYAKLRAIFVSNEGYDEEVRAGTRHPLSHGLWEDVDSIVEYSLKPLVEQFGSVEEVKDHLRRESMWLHARQEFANKGRLLLEDREQVDGEDWVRLITKLLTAGAEVDYLDSLGTQRPGDVSQLRADIARVEALLLGTALKT